MNELQVIKEQEVQTISSKEVAEMMNVRHSDLLGKIDKINKDFENEKIRFQKYWIESAYKVPGNNKSYREFQVTKLGCEFLAHKSTGTKGNLFTARYMDRFNEMEKIITSDEQLKAKLLLNIYNGGQEGILASRELVELEKKPLIKTIETQKPKVDYHDKVLNVDKLVTTTDIAKDLGMTARQLHNKLHDMKIIFKTGNHWTFYAKYQTRIPLYADYQIGEHGQILKWTEKGRKWIIKLLNEQKEKDKNKD